MNYITQPLEHFLNLQNLNLNRCLLGDAIVERFAEMLFYLNRLEHLSMGMNNLGDKSNFYKIFHSIVNYDYLETLYIPGNYINSEDVYEFAGIVPNLQSLRSVFIHKN